MIGTLPASLFAIVEPTTVPSAIETLRTVEEAAADPLFRYVAAAAIGLGAGLLLGGVGTYLHRRRALADRLP